MTFMLPIYEYPLNMLQISRDVRTGFRMERDIRLQLVWSRSSDHKPQTSYVKVNLTLFIIAKLDE